MEIENELSGVRRTAQCLVLKDQVSRRGMVLQVAEKPALSGASGPAQVTQEVLGGEEAAAACGAQFSGRIMDL